MILDPNSTVQPETTSTLSHKRAICDEASCTCVLIQSHDQKFFFRNRKNLDLPGSSNKTLSRSGLSRHGRCFWDGWSCATKCEKCEKNGQAYIKSIREVSKVFSTSPNMRMWLFLKIAMHFVCFAWVAGAPLFLHSLILLWTSQGSGCILHVCLLSLCLSSCLSPFSSTLSSQFSAILTSRQWTTSTARVLGMINLHKCTQLFVNRIF